MSFYIWGALCYGMAVVLGIVAHEGSDRILLREYEQTIESQNRDRAKLNDEIRRLEMELWKLKE